MRKVSKFIVRHRLFIMLLFIGITGFFAYHAMKLPVRISLEKFFPYDHPFVKLNKDLGSQFGGTNTMLIMIKSKQGSIYNQKTIDDIKKTTDYFYYKDYVLRSLAASVTLSKSKYVLGQGLGEIKMAPIFPPDLDNTQESFEFAKKMVSQSPVFHGLLVSDDSTAALIIMEVDETKLNYNDFRKDLLTIKNTIESGGSASLAFAGRPVLMSWIYDLSKNIYLIIGIVGILCLIMLFYFFRDIYGVIAVSLVAVCCAVWGLGCMSLLNYDLSPLMFILPVLISTRAVSHSIQLHSRFVEECDAAGGDRLVSLDNTFFSMLIPNFSAVFTDALGFFILYLIKITLLQEVGISMGIWILTLVPLSGIMMPILCTYFPYHNKRKSPSNAKFDLGKISQGIGMFSMKRTGTVFIAVTVAVLLVFSLFYARKIQVGDIYPGSSILFPNAVYNRDTKKINDTFSKAGADGLILFFQGRNDAIKKPETLKYLDRFERYMVENVDAANGAWSLVTALKNINMEIHDGDPKWSLI
ncbi:MAG: MMPL family transporter, partial [Thermodesulfovibrionales bacterium]